VASHLDRLVDDFIAEELAESPVLATVLGVDGHDHELGDFSAEAMVARDRRAGVWLDRFAGLPDDNLSAEERIDRDLAVARLRGRTIMSDWQAWRRDPAVYLGPCLNGVFTLFIHRLHDEAELAGAATDRLRLVEQVLAAAETNLDAELCNPLILDRAIGQCRAGARYARELVPGEVDDAGCRAILADAGEAAALAYERFQARLEQLAAHATGPYAIGEDHYSALLEKRELLGYDAREMRERGRAAYAALDEEMGELAERIAPGSGWRTVLERLNADHPDSPESMRAAYEHWTETARRHLVENAVVTVPDGEECLVVPSPPFQRPVLAVASYMAPPAFRPSRRGHFFVPFPPDGTPEAEVQKRLETNSFSSIPTIAAHETYPGHHWHLVWMQGRARPLRRLLRTPYFSEGWALYAEALMREHGFFADPRRELAHLDARIFRAARIVVDTSLHIGDMDVAGAVEFMRTKASLSEPTARAEVGRYCATPTQASAYLTGALEIERIRAGYLDAGLGDVRSFNDTIAASGALPIALAERAVMVRRGEGNLPPSGHPPSD